MRVRIGVTSLLVVALAACSGRGDGGADGGPRDAGVDAHGGDAGRDAGADASSDGAPSDAGDAGSDAGDAGSDAGDAGSDAGSDAAPSDAGSDAGPGDAGTTSRVECVAAVAGNELSSGMVLDSAVWVGFRFQITSATTATAVGLNVQNIGTGAGTLFGAIVALTDMSDAPDAPDLTTPDVLATTTLALGPPGGLSTDISAPISVALPAGWYAVVFGSGSFGAVGASAIVHSNSGAGGCTGGGGGFPFSIRQSDGMFILQAATPNFYVATSP